MYQFFTLISYISRISILVLSLSRLFALVLYCHSFLVSFLSLVVSLLFSKSVKSIFESHCSHLLYLSGSYSQTESPCCSPCHHFRCSLSWLSSCPGSLSLILRIYCYFATFIEIMLVSHLRSLILFYSFTREVISISDPTGLYQMI